MEYQTKIIKPLTVGDHRLIGDIIAHSFADDPVNVWIFGKHISMRNYYTAMARKLYLQQGYGHVIENNGGTLWLPPNISDHIPLVNSLDIAASMIRHSGLNSLIRGMTVENELSRKKPKEVFYYLFAIGCRPGQQGRGFGASLMQAGLERADIEQVPAYLESSKESNLPFYRRFGFEVIERVSPGKDCPPLWLMWREPQ